MTGRDPPSSSTRVLLLARSGTLLEVPPALGRQGWTVLRAATIDTAPVRMAPPPSWFLHVAPRSIWLVTSRTIAEEVWPANPAWHQSLRRVPEVLSVGPATARSLRRLGIRPVAIPEPVSGTRSLLRRCRGLRGRLVVYLRSDRAGRAVGSALRARGARVLERVAYRTRPSRVRRHPSLGPLSGTRAWLVASPSALEGIRSSLGRSAFGREIRRVELFALGPRTARAIRALGGRRVRVPRRSTGTEFTRFVAERLGDAHP